jgi:uncharacterized protein YuzE
VDGGKMKVNYDPEADILYIVIREGPIKDTVEAEDEILIEIAEDESIVGIEIWKASKNILEPIAKELSAKLENHLKQSPNNKL